MSSGGGGNEIGKIIGGFILVVLVMFVIWYYTGGPQRTDTAHPFQQPLAPLGNGETYGPNTPTN